MANVKTKLTPDEHKVFDYYLAGGERGDLFSYVKRGKLGVMKPERSHGLAYAAWLAGWELRSK